MRLAYMTIGVALLALAGLPAVAADRPSYARDDSWSSVPPDTLEKSVKLLGRDMADPSSMQVRLLAPMTGGSRGMCGEVNQKNSSGYPVGFLPFIASLDSGATEILPAKSYTLDGIKEMRTKMISECPAWSAYADREAQIEAAIAKDPDVDASSPSMIALNYCNYTADSADAFHLCAELQTKAELRIAAIRGDTSHHDEAEALYADCYDVTPGLEGGSFKSVIALYECMVAPGSPFESMAP